MRRNAPQHQGNPSQDSKRNFTLLARNTPTITQSRHHGRRFYVLFPRSDLPLSSSLPFPAGDGQRVFVTKDRVVEKHVADHVAHVVAFADVLWVMLRPDKTDGDGAQLAVTFFHQTAGAGLCDEFRHLDAGGIGRVGGRGARLDEA